MQFLYKDGTDAHFMDTESYEQLTIPESTLADALRLMKESEEVELLYIDDEPADVQLPSAIDLEVAETEPGAARRHRLGRRHQAGGAGDRRRGSRCRCSSTSAMSCASTRARASTSRVPDRVPPPASRHA